MKIGIDIRTLMDVHYSGVPEYTYNLIKEILKLDVKNTCKLFYNSGRDASQNIPDFKFENCEIIKTRYPNKVFNYLMQKTLKYPKIDKLLGVNVLFTPHINFISLSGNSKKIITIHDLSFLRYPEFFSLRKNFWHWAINVKKLLKKFDIIVAVSENTKKDIIELCEIPEEKIKVIYSGIDNIYQKIEKNNSDLNRVKEKYSLPEKFILYLGTIEPRKNIEGLIKAFEIFKQQNPEHIEIHLVLAGARGWKSKEIFDVWKSSKQKEKIKFLGYVDKKDKVYLYNSALVFVYPSFYEGFGFPPMEALSCGIPTITSAFSSLPEILGNKALMINPYNINDISRAIKEIVNRKEYYKIKQETVFEKFSWSSSAKEYIKLFN